MLTTRCSRRTRDLALAALAGLSLLALTGCPLLTRGDVEGNLLRQLLGLGPLPFTPGTLVIRVINNTGDTGELELEVDGAREIIQVTPPAEFGDVFFPVCPTHIRLLETRITDETGAFLGGLTFSPDDEFYQFEGDRLPCGGVLLLRIDVGSIEVFFL